MEEFDQVRCPLTGLPKAWQRPLKVLIKYNRIKLKRISSKIELLILINCEKYIFKIFLLSNGKVKKVLSFSHLNKFSSNRCINCFFVVSANPEFSKKKDFKFMLKLFTFPPYKKPLDQ